jgi:hypothetical protein
LGEKAATMAYLYLYGDAREDDIDTAAFIFMTYEYGGNFLADSDARRYPREWLIRRPAVEKIMGDASKNKMQTWDEILSRKNIWSCGQPGVGQLR